MDCREFQKGLKNWLETKWLKDIEVTSDIEDLKEFLPQNLIEHARKCKSCYSLLEGTVHLVSGKELKKKPPEELYNRIKISLAQNQKSITGRKFSIENILPKILVGNEKIFFKWVFIPVASLVLVILMFIFVLYPLKSDFKTNKERIVVVHLYFKAPGAREVSVVGDWNGWNPNMNKMRDPDGDGVWEIELKLKSGKEYQYQFLIDGTKWLPDPNAPIQVEDGFGGKNSVLHI